MPRGRERTIGRGVLIPPVAAAGAAGPSYTGPGGVVAEAWWDVASAGATPSAGVHYFTTVNDALQNQVITGITDRSGHNRDLSRVGGVSFGTWSDAGFNSLGEVACAGGSAATAAVGSAIPQPFSVFVIGAFDSDGTPAHQYWFASKAASDVAVRNSSSVIYMFNGNNNIGDSAVLDVTHALYHFEFGSGGSAGTMRAFRNGTGLNAADTTNSLGHALTTNFVIGSDYDGTNPLSTEARWSEVAVFSSVLAGADLTAVKTYFANKYGLTIA